MFNTIQLIKSSQTPLYLQLANGLASCIENDQLTPGTKLPSIRSLAKQLKINRDTVVSAYKVLEQRGLAFGQTGRGTYVSPPPSLEPLPPTTLEPFSLTHKDLINFASTTLPDYFFPIESLMALSANLLSAKQWDAFYDYDDSKYQLLQKEICAYFKANAIQTIPDQIRITQGLAELIQALPRHPGKSGVCIETPSMGTGPFEAYGFQTFPVPLQQNGLDTHILEQHFKTGKIQYLFITPYLQNPTGICYSQENQLEILALTKAYNVCIIENDTFGNVLLEDINYISLFSQAPRSNIIYVKHFSQLYLPRLHYIFIVLPNAFSNLTLRPHPYHLTDCVLTDFLQGKAWKSVETQLITCYRKRFLLLQDLVDLHLSPYFSYTASSGGIYMWLTLEASHISLKDLCDELLVNHVLISPGSLFFQDDCELPCIRLSMAKVNTSQMEKGIRIMASILSGGKFK